MKVYFSFNTQFGKQKPKTKLVYDYKNADAEGLINYFKQFDFENIVFRHPIVNQTEIYSNVLKEAFAKFVPCNSVIIRPSDQSWCNSHTRLLLRKNNRNYYLFKKMYIRL